MIYTDRQLFISNYLLIFSCSFLSISTNLGPGGGFYISNNNCLLFLNDLKFFNCSSESLGLSPTRGGSGHGKVSGGGFFFYR